MTDTKEFPIRDPLELLNFMRRHQYHVGMGDYRWSFYDQQRDGTPEERKDAYYDTINRTLYVNAGTRLEILIIEEREKELMSDM